MNEPMICEYGTRADQALAGLCGMPAGGAGCNTQRQVGSSARNNDKWHGGATQPAVIGKPFWTPVLDTAPAWTREYDNPESHRLRPWPHGPPLVARRLLAATSNGVVSTARLLSVSSCLTDPQ